MTNGGGGVIQRRSAPVTALRDANHWRDQFNRVIGTTSRLLFQAPLRVQHCSTRDLHARFPELARLVVDAFTLSGAHEQGAEVLRGAFADVRAKWLDRSAVESGATSVLCRLMLQAAMTTATATTTVTVTVRVILRILLDPLLHTCMHRRQDHVRVCEWAHGKPPYYAMPCSATWTALLPFLARLVVHAPSSTKYILAEYLEEAAQHDWFRQRVNCRFAQVVGLWRLVAITSQLAPGGDGYSVAVDEEGEEPEQIEEYSEGRDCANGTEQSVVGCVVPFVIKWVLMSCCEHEVTADRHFDDLLLEKFVQSVQEYTFLSTQYPLAEVRGEFKVVILEELKRYPQQLPPALTDQRDRLSEEMTRLRILAMMTATACLFIRDLAVEIGAAITLSRRHDDDCDQVGGFPLVFVIGLVSHVEQMSGSVILSVVHELLDRYQAVRVDQTEQIDDSTDVDSNTSVASAFEVHNRRHYLFWVIYIVLSRQQATKAMQTSTSQRDMNASDDNQVAAEFTRFQERICSHVDISDMQQMPLHWMEVFWKACFGMTALEVAAFVEEAKAARVTGLSTGGEPPVTLFATQWRSLLTAIPFRCVDSFPAISKILGDPYAATLRAVVPSPSKRIHVAVDEAWLESNATYQQEQSQKRRRRVVVLSEEQEESRQNVLLLPDVMQRVCGFMSAKRLCRLSLVCHAFAEVARRPSLWRALYTSLARSLGVTCRHGSRYEHHWRLMYQALHAATRKLRAKQRSVARQLDRQTQDERAHAVWNQSEREQDAPHRLALALANVTICNYCGCNQILTTSVVARTHNTLHDRYACLEPDCRASVTSALALKHHIKTQHPASTTQKPQQVAKTRRVNKTVEITSNECKAANSTGNERQATRTISQESGAQTRHICSAPGCTKTYKSTKWLQTHYQRVHHNDATQSG